jgi:hypothetical protein
MDDSRTVADFVWIADNTEVIPVDEKLASRQVRAGQIVSLTNIGNNNVQLPRNRAVIEEKCLMGPERQS